MPGTYPLAKVYKDVAHIVRATGEDDATSIRTKINNQLDCWDKAGFKVNHDYDQENAIKAVRRLVKTI